MDHRIGSTFFIYSFSVKFECVWTLCDVSCPDTLVLWGGCMANRWSSTCWVWRRENTCSAKHSRWLLFRKYSSWSGYNTLVKCLSVLKYDKTIEQLFCFLYCVKTVFVFAHRVTWKLQSMQTLWECWTLTIIRWLKVERLTSSTVSWNPRSASFWRNVVSSTTQGRPAFRGEVI